MPGYKEIKMHRIEESLSIVLFAVVAVVACYLMYT